MGSILDDIKLPTLFKRRRKLGGVHHYDLTPVGKQKAEQFSAELHGVRWQVMAYLDENGASTFREILSEVNVGEEKLRAILNSLIMNGYIQKVERAG